MMAITTKSSINVNPLVSLPALLRNWLGPAWIVVSDRFAFRFITFQYFDFIRLQKVPLL